MGNVGLLLVGAVLLVNGLVILSVVPARSAALLNLFVGSAQVVLPTIVLVQSAGDPAVLNATWPSYLFGFTYLYYGLGIYLNLEPEGLGWFSSFVAAIAGYEAVTTVGSDPVFAVIWLTWATMWLLFFLLMAQGRTQLERFTGWYLVLLGVPTCTVSAIFLMENRWTTTPAAGWTALTGLVLAGAVAWALARSPLARSALAGPPTAGEPPARGQLVGEAERVEVAAAPHDDRVPLPV